MRLRGRRILVTGAASGIGRAVALRFGEEGAQVALLDRNRDGLAETAAAAGGSPTIAVDLGSADAVAPAVEAAAAALGGLDGIVNAAGADLLRPLETMTEAEWRLILEVNLTAPMLVCRAAVPALRAAGSGTIVNIASGAALRPLENRTAYCAAKAGLVMFGKALSIELSPLAVRVNAICPGIIDTPMFRASWERTPDPQRELAKILDRYVIRRVGLAEEIAAAALFLTSSESSYITGAALAVDGGRTFH